MENKNYTIKIFEETSEYQTFVQSDEYVEPHVSLTKDDNVVHYNLREPLGKTKVIGETSHPNTLHIYDSAKNLLMSGYGDRDNDVVGYINIPSDGILLLNGHTDGVGTYQGEGRDPDLGEWLSTFTDIPVDIEELYVGFTPDS